MRTRIEAVIVVGLAVVAGGGAGCSKRLDVFSEAGVLDVAAGEARRDVAPRDLAPKAPYTTVWVKVFGEPTTSMFVPKGVLLDGEGNIYFSAWLFGKIQLGQDLLGADDVEYQAMVKLDPQGKVLWARQGGADLSSRGHVEASENTSTERSKTGYLRVQPTTSRVATRGRYPANGLYHYHQCRMA